MRQILLAALLMASTPALADDADFQPWLACAARVMAYDGTPWNIAYFPGKHPDGHLGYAMRDGEGYATVWAMPEKPWVQLHEACHVIQFANGATGDHSTPAMEAECRIVQERWQECN